MLKIKICFLTTIIFLLPLITKFGKCSTLSGTVSFSDISLMDSISITIDSYYQSDHVSYSKQWDLDFSFDLEPGKYQLSIKSNKSSAFNTHLLITDYNTKLSLDINLKPKGQESTVVIEGFKYYEEYNSLVNDINTFNKKLFSINLGTANMEVIEAHNLQKTADLMRLKEKYTPYFEQIFIENQLSHLAIFHPLTQLFKEFTRDGVIDSLDKIQIYNNDIFQKYFSKNIKLLRQLDPNSILLDGSFSMALMRMEVFESQLYNEGKIDKDYFYNFLTDFIYKTTNKYCAANLLFNNGERYSEDNPERAMFLLTWLKDDYPNYRTVTNGELTKVLNRIKLNNLPSAPDFTVVSVSGQTIRLSDYKNKFVFLDFWATWCRPCREEIPNIKKLHESCSTVDLQIIGLANDKHDILSKYIKDNNILYPNVIADEKLLTLYGVTGYPTTFLLAPNGEIVGKYFRGENLVDLVKNEIKKYKNETH
jgi:peroxiredoxin